MKDRMIRDFEETTDCKNVIQLSNDVSDCGSIERKATSQN